MIALRHLFGNNLDRNLAIGGLFVGPLIIVLLLFISPNYIDVGITILISCAVYLALRKRVNPSAITFAQSSTLRLVLNIAFFALLSYVILLLYLNTYVRPLAYFISVALMAALLAVEILQIPENTKGNSGFILFKVLVLAVILRWSLYYMYPSGFLGVDPWHMCPTVDRISQLGYIPRDIGGYYHMPMLYLTESMTSQLLDVSTKTSMIISVGLFEIISLIFIFLIGRDVFDTRVGLLSALTLGIANLHISWGWWIVAMTLAASFAIFALFLLLRPPRGNPAKFRAMAMIILVVLILTHHLTAFATLVMLAALYLGYRLYVSFSKKEGVPFTQIGGATIALFGVALIGYWAYIAGFFGRFVRMSLGSGITVPATTFTPVVTVSPVWLEVNKVGILLLYGLAIIGILSTLSHKNISLPRFRLVFCAAFLTVFVFVAFFFNIEWLYICRWFLFIQILLVIPAALGLMSIYSAVRTAGKGLILVGTVVFLLASLMVLNTEASGGDNPIYPSTMSDRRAYTDSELQAAHTITTISEYTPKADCMYVYPFAVGEGNPIQVLPLEEVETKFSEAAGLIVLRKYTIDNSLTVIRGGKNCKYVFTYNPYEELDKQGFNCIYNAGTVTAYHKQR